MTINEAASYTNLLGWGGDYGALLPAVCHRRCGHRVRFVCCHKGKAEASRAKFGSDLSAAVLKKTGKKDANGNELTVWQDYVAGTDPTDVNSQFTASVSFVNGKPVITWSPALNGEGVKEGVRVYRTFGAKSLTSAFEEVKAGTEAAYQFFKVTVDMP